MWIFKFLASIFFDSRHSPTNTVSIQELGNHYRNELDQFYLDQIWVASEYKYTKEIIERFKYHSEREYAVQLSEYFIALSNNCDVFPNDGTEWVIVPVPMHWSRYFMRGFDHIWLLSQKVSEATGIPYRKILTTSFRFRQSKLSRNSRLANKKNAFRMKNHFSISWKNVILIDDVISSGSTANACAEVLKIAGAKKVIGWFIASNN